MPDGSRFELEGGSPSNNTRLNRACPQFDSRCHAEETSKPPFPYRRTIAASNAISRAHTETAIPSARGKTDILLAEVSGIGAPTFYSEGFEGVCWLAGHLIIKIPLHLRTKLTLTGLPRLSLPTITVGLCLLVNTEGPTQG
jgi:hypothetical protein